nr:hypothetical protein [Tanacetum cinerariifolium]
MAHLEKQFSRATVKGSHETFQCQPDNQNIEFSDSDQIQTPQYLDVNPPSPEINLKELAEYDQSTSTDRPIFLNDNEDHPVQNRASLENSSEENVVSKTNQEPPQNSDIHQLIEEYFVEVPEQQKQNMEKTIQFLCMHDNVDDLIESAIDYKLLSINSINSQRLDKKEQEVKNVEEQPAERRNRIEKSLQNFRVIHKSSISLNTSQISSIHEVAPILSTKEPENSLSMGYEHLSITPETESDEVTESNAKNLLQIPRECESDNSLLDNFSPEFETFCDNSEETRSGNTTHANYSLPEYDSFCFEIEPDQERLINLVENDNSDSSNDPLLEEANLFLSDNSIPPGIENVANDPEGDIRFLKELLIDDFILSYESSDSNFEDSPLIPQPPPEPPDDNFDLEPEVISAIMEDIDEPDEHFNPGGEIFVSINNEDVDYFPFMFVIRIFLTYLIHPEISRLLLSAESEDTIFYPGIFE